MPTSKALANLDKDQLKKVSSALAKRLAVNIVLGVTVAVAVSLISGVILNAVAPAEETAE